MKRKATLSGKSATRVAEARRRPVDSDGRQGFDRLRAVRSDVPAVTHVDYSARLQTVDAERHGRFAALLRTFEAKTGCPVMVNTSFNVRGEPIVRTLASRSRRHAAPQARPQYAQLLDRAPPP